MPATPKEIFERYVWAGALSRDADALAEMFTEDGVLEAPLVPAGATFPNRLVGREQIRTAMAEYYRLPAEQQAGEVDVAKSGYAMHTTGDPDVFVAEIDTVLTTADGPVTVSLVQIFRVRDGKIARLRDYFAPDLMA
ncbi:nuclear transport factor 2 family protein [Solihabitans fulvus]|uniref:Nuclear transport factor 2 family protein n=1 Tax=Solihabitans fulvus TaxID=1892852 RepID=A0A5B2X4D4_9PSEU|nr:nuclear transport factor 2 family protein [Solihabitans fulvus]KAA2258094.1 nuclear transport factor 2 family protein [Solihabitans fulvus]